MISGDSATNSTPSRRTTPLERRTTPQKPSPTWNACKKWHLQTRKEMPCPNSNPYGPFFSRQPKFRQNLYYGVCLPIRLSILAYMWIYPQMSAALAKVAALVFLLATDHRRRLRSHQWWSHAFVAGTATAILIVPVNIVKWVFAASILGGIVQAHESEFC